MTTTPMTDWLMQNVFDPLIDPLMALLLVTLTLVAVGMVIVCVVTGVRDLVAWLRE